MFALPQDEALWRESAGLGASVGTWPVVAKCSSSMFSGFLRSSIVVGRGATGTSLEIPVVPWGAELVDKPRVRDAPGLT